MDISSSFVAFSGYITFNFEELVSSEFMNFKELKCVLCNIGFTKNSELKQHMKTKHLEISHGKEKSLSQKIVEIMYPR